MLPAKPNLSGPGFRFRALSLDDHADLAAAAADQRYWQYLPEGPRTPDQVLAFLKDAVTISSDANGGQTWWAIEHSDSRRFLGTANLKRIGAPEDKVCSVGCTLVPDAQGQGLGTRIGWTLIRSAFVDFGMHHVECTCAEGNEMSCHIMRDVYGMTYDGLRRAQKKTPRGWWSSHVFGVAAEDFPALDAKVSEKLQIPGFEKNSG